MVPLLPDNELERHIQRGSIEGEFINWAIECHTALLVNQIEPAGPPSIFSVTSSRASTSATNGILSLRTQEAACLRFCSNVAGSGRSMPSR